MEVQHKAGWRYYFFLVFFGAASILGLRVIWMLLNGQVMDGDQPMSRGVAVILSIVIGIAFSTYIETTLILLWQLLRYNGCGLEITEKGVEHTLVWVNILCIVLVLPVRCIPWEAVKYADLENGPYIRVHVKQVDAGLLAKAILWVLGYHFCYSFVKPAVTSGEIERYQHRFSIPNE